jgi:hypothetical protein
VVPGTRVQPRRPGTRGRNYFSVACHLMQGFVLICMLSLEARHGELRLPTPGALVRDAEPFEVTRVRT